jgi:signal transduction histidine kinase
VARDASGGIAFSVADTGIGMSEAERAHAFDLFWQADSGDTRARSGTGIGLAIARRFMDLHGCTIELESAPGKGTTAVARFPAARTIG